MPIMGFLARRAGLRVFRFLSRPLADPVADTGAFRLRMLGEAETLTWCAAPELDLVREKVSGAFARGDLCVGAFEGARLIGYCWLAFASLPHLDDVWVEFPADTVWTYKSFVRISHRGARIAPALYRFADGACLERGRSVSIICVESRNRSSVNAALRAGYATAGWGAYLRAGSRLRAWYSPAVRQRRVRFLASPREEREH